MVALQSLLEDRKSKQVSTCGEPECHDAVLWQYIKLLLINECGAKRSTDQPNIIAIQWAAVVAV